MRTKAQKDAQTRYDRAHKDDFCNVHLKIRKKGNENILKKLEEVEKKQTYILDLIRKDIEKGGG